jgi:hypothetical protein
MALPAFRMSWPTPLTVLQPASTKASDSAMRVAVFFMSLAPSVVGGKTVRRMCGCHKVPVHGRGGGHGGAHEVGAAARALAAFEVAVAGGGAALAGLQAVGIHGQAHGAAGFAPFKACGLEDLVQAFALGLFLDQARAGYHHGQLDVFGHLAAQLLDHGGGFAHVFDAAVGARADEHLVDEDVVDRLAGLQAHVGQGALHGAALVGVFFLVGVGHAGVHAQHHFGRGAPGDLRHDVARRQLHHRVELARRRRNAASSSRPRPGPIPRPWATGGGP